MESTTNLSRTESIVDFETPAILHSLRDHKDLRAEDLRRESLIKIKVEKKMFKNQPICKFARDLVSQSGYTFHCLKERVEKKVERFQDRWDKRREKTHDDSIDAEHSYCWTSSRRASRQAQTTRLHAIALANPSNEILHIQRSRNRDRKPSEAEMTERPKSMEVLQLVQQELPSAMRRTRAMSNLTADTVDTFLVNSGSSTVLNSSPSACNSSSPTTTSSWRWSSDITTALAPSAPKSCMRYPKTSKQEAVVVAAADAVKAGKASPYITRTESRRLSSLSLTGRRRMVSISYKNGNEDIGAPTIEGVDGVRRPRLVVFRFGEGVDEVLPVAKWSRWGKRVTHDIGHSEKPT